VETNFICDLCKTRKADDWNAEHCSARKSQVGSSRAMLGVPVLESRFCSVEIISLTPRFNAVNHERAQEKPFKRFFSLRTPCAPG
jgi:hypothetical protein